MARVPWPVDRASRGVMRCVAASPYGRLVTERVLRGYYARARERGLGETAIPLWYQWLRAYYFSALRRRLPNDAFQRKYWEMGSLTDYQRYLVKELSDVRIQRFLAVVAERVAALGIGSRTPTRVLEIGCGTAFPLQALRAAIDDTVPLHLVGLDISMNALSLAKSALGDTASLLQASITAMPFSPRFDLGFCRGVLMFLDEQAVREAFAEVGRTCGVLVLTEPANLGGEPVRVEDLKASVRRDGVDQVSWIHPYFRLAAESGGVVTMSETVKGNLLMVVEWNAAARQGGAS